MEQKLKQFLLWTKQILIKTYINKHFIDWAIRVQLSGCFIVSIWQEHLEQETRLGIGCFGKTVSSPYLDRLRGKKDNRDSWDKKNAGQIRVVEKKTQKTDKHISFEK